MGVQALRPGDEMIFSGFTDSDTDISSQTSKFSQVIKEEEYALSTHHASTSGCKFNVPLDDQSLQDLSHKNFAPDTMKKVRWVTKMYRDRRNYRHSLGLEFIQYDLDDKYTITKDRLIFALVHFITEVNKVDGTDFPGRTLYDTIVCLQFHLKT